MPILCRIFITLQTKSMFVTYFLPGLHQFTPEKASTLEKKKKKEIL